MEKGSRVNVKGNSRRRMRQREELEDSDEEYKVGEDEECDESDEYCSLDDDGEEDHEDFIVKRAARSRNTRHTSSVRTGNKIKKLRKKRRISYKEDEEEEEDGDAEFMPWCKKGKEVLKPRVKKRVSYREEGEEDDSECSGWEGNKMKNPREKRRNSCAKKGEDEDNNDDDDDEEEEEDEDDSESLSSGKKGKGVLKPRAKKRVSYREEGEEDDSECSGWEGNGMRNPREKRRNLCAKKGENEDEDNNDDDDEAEEEEDADDSESLSSGKKGNGMKKSREKRRISHTEEDNDDDDDDGDGDGDEEEGEDDAEYMYSGRKRKETNKLRAKRMVSYREEDDADGGEEEDEEEGEDSESMSSGTKGNGIKISREKRRILFTKEEEDEEEDDDGDGDEECEDDPEYMYSGRKRKETKRPRAKRRVSYKEVDDEDDEDDEDDVEFKSSSRKGNQIKMPRGKRRVSYIQEDNDDEVEDEDEDDDAEFMLSESDFIDDEDDSPKIKKNEKVKKYYRQQKKSFGRGQKRSRKSKVLKKRSRPKPRNRRSMRNTSSSKDEPVTNKTLQLDERSMKISGQRKRRTTAESDLDLVSSASSDHEYTISEEEREQMREARVYCANLRAKLRSTSSGKQEEEPICNQRKCPVRKGKEKIEDVKDEIGNQVCGICLTEEGKRTVRGALNCCRHHFCFSCIMEWSKVESRCPLCKQRFATITKAARSDTGFDLRTMVISVPERDQIYQPSEEELRGYLDPYESVICTECHHGGEDEFMLLCDICDSPAHTFCVGLGYEVPEGNWYCDGCKPTVFSSLHSQRPTPTPDRRLSSNASDLSSPLAGGFDLNELFVPETPLQETQDLPEPRLPIGPAPAGNSATTLRDRRRIHRHIHHRLLNNNRLSEFITRSSGTSASSLGIRLFGSQLDQVTDSTLRQTSTHEMASMAANPHAVLEGREDHIMPSTHDESVFSPSVNHFGVQIQNSMFTSVDGLPQAELGGSGMGFDSRLGYAQAQLHPYSSRSSIRSDPSPSPYPCREAIGTSRASQGGLHTPY